MSAGEEEVSPYRIKSAENKKRSLGPAFSLNQATFLSSPANVDDSIDGVLLVKGCIVCYIFQIFLRITIEDQVGVTNRIIVDQII